MLRRRKIDVRALRERMGLSKAMFAQKFHDREMTPEERHTARRTVQRWEDGTSTPHPMHHRRLEELLKEQNDRDQRSASSSAHSTHRPDTNESAGKPIRRALSKTEPAASSSARPGDEPSTSAGRAPRAFNPLLPSMS